MEVILNFNLPLSFQQVADMVRQLPKTEKIELAKILQKDIKNTKQDITQTHFASQAILAQDWLNQEEENAWQHL
jgi:hypothetical protein